MEIRPFEQTEPETRRTKINNYPDVKSKLRCLKEKHLIKELHSHSVCPILQELVQNADDAEASEMGILYQGDQTNDINNLKFEKFLKVK